MGHRQPTGRRHAGWAVLLIGAALAAGCAQNRLVSRPPGPIFGPRTVARRAVAPAVPATPTPAVAYTSESSLWQPHGTERPWRYIVIHHSASPTGSAAKFDAIHRAKGWDELGYHFVIGNGRGSGDGEVEIGSRWFKQKHGAHCKVSGHPEYNDVGIGICLVGNFDESRPTEAQMESLSRLVRYLMDRYHVSRDHVYGHGQLKATDCPGRNFSYAELWRRVGR